MKNISNTKKIIRVSIITIFVLCIFTNFNISTANAIVDLSFLQATSDATDLTTYTFASQNLGTAAADRVIIVTMATRKAGTAALTFDSVTIGGVSATINIQRQYAPANTSVAAIASAVVPTGTTGDIVITMSATVLRMQIGVSRVTGVADHTTMYDSGGDDINPIAVSLNIPAGGFAVGAVVAGAVNNANNWTWANLTENYEINSEANMPSTGASNSFATAQTGLAISATGLGGSEGTGVFASWAEVAPPASVVKTIRGLIKASVKTINGMAIASIKKFNGTQ
jgi:hypothetical protein